MDACTKAAEALTTGQSAINEALTNCVTDKNGVASPAKETVKQALAKETVTDTEVREFVLKGAMDRVGQKQESCMQVAAANATKIAACATSAEGHIAKSLGKKANAVDDADVKYFQKQAMFGKVQEAVEGCLLTLTLTLTLTLCLVRSRKR